MTDYQKLYTFLFNGISDAIAALDRNNYGTARDLLVKAQQEAEEQYLTQTDGD